MLKIICYLTQNSVQYQNYFVILKIIDIVLSNMLFFGVFIL